MTGIYAMLERSDLLNGELGAVRLECFIMSGHNTAITFSAAEMEDDPTYEEFLAVDKLNALTSSATKSVVCSSYSDACVLSESNARLPSVGKPMFADCSDNDAVRSSAITGDSALTTRSTSSFLDRSCRVV